MAIEMPNYIERRQPGPKHPRQILLETAAVLLERTNHKIQGNVFTVNSAGENMFSYTFYLMAPDLDDYSIPLFYAWHGLNAYPVYIKTEHGQAQKMPSVDHLVTHLSELFAGEYATDLIQSILKALNE